MFLSKLLKSNFLILVTILLIGSCFRFSGIYPGYPPYHSDEGMGYAQGAAILKEGKLDANGYSLWLSYPSLVPYINALFFKIIFVPFYWGIYFLENIDKFLDGIIKLPFTQLELSQILQNEILGVREINALLWGRIIAASFGIGIIFLTYLFGKKFINNRVGLIAAFFVAINYRHVLNSHLGLPDIYSSFFLLLSMIFSFNLIKNHKPFNYLLAGIFMALSFGVKFQVFSVLPFLASHFFVTQRNKNLILSIKNFFSRNLFIAFTCFVVVFVLLNPFIFIYWEDFLYQFKDVSLKYAAGRNSLDLFGIIYLYKFGLGYFLSFLFVVGAILISIYNKKTFLVIFSVIVPFLIVTNYLTIGGFYTRNYITVIPLFILIASFGIDLTFLKIKAINKFLAIFVLFLVVFFVSKDHIKNSSVVGKEYKKTWNYKIAEVEANELIPENAVVAMHSSVLIRESQKKVPYELDKAFSLEEFREEGASYAISNLDWSTVDFYWWMTVGIDDFRFFNKPVQILEETYPALALRELSDYSIFNVVNPWQAPDSNFVGSEVPSYKISQKKLVRNFDFSKNEEEWKIVGDLEKPFNNFEWVKENNGSLKMGKGSSGSKTIHWESSEIKVKPGEGYVVEGIIKTDAELSENIRDGFIRVDFYTKDKRIGTRLTARSTKNIDKKEVIVKVPENADSMRIGFQVYNNLLGNFYLDNLSIYSVNVSEILSNKTEKFVIPTDVIFPNSHGGL